MATQKEIAKQAYISRVHLKGYKSIKDLEIDLRPGLNILIGPNGSGKTNFLDYLDKIIQNQVQESKTRHWGRITYYKQNGKACLLEYDVVPNNVIKENAQEVHIIYFDDNNKVLYEKNYLKINNRELYKNIHVISETDWAFEFDLDKETSNLINFGIKNEFQNLLSNPINFEIEDIFHHLAVNSISTIINNFRFNQDETKLLEIIIYPNFITCLQNFTPISDFKFEVEDSRIEKGIVEDENEHADGHEFFSVKNVKAKFLMGNKWLSWQMLSDGTKRIFYLVYSVFTSNYAYVFLEEPELGIHPDQLYKLMDFLKEQSEHKQIIITTHSPEVLNILSEDELDRIIVTRYDYEKGTQMHKLSTKQIKKGQLYMKKVGHLSDYWIHSNLEEYEVEEQNG